MPPLPQHVESRLDLWRSPLTYWPSTHQGLSTYQIWSFWGKTFLRYPLHKVRETDMAFDLDLWPTSLNINSDHLLIKDYLPTKFEASTAKRSWVISCVWCWRSTWPMINRDHLLVTVYLPTEFEASGAKYCLVISCTRYWWSTWPFTLTFDKLTSISIGIIYSSRTIYLPSLKLIGQSVLEVSVAQG